MPPLHEGSLEGVLSEESRAPFFLIGVVIYSATEIFVSRDLPPPPPRYYLLVLTSGIQALLDPTLPPDWAITALVPGAYPALANHVVTSALRHAVPLPSGRRQRTHPVTRGSRVFPPCLSTPLAYLGHDLINPTPCSLGLFWWPTSTWDPSE